MFLFKNHIRLATKIKSERTYILVRIYKFLSLVTALLAIRYSYQEFRNLSSKDNEFYSVDFTSFFIDIFTSFTKEVGVIYSAIGDFSINVTKLNSENKTLKSQILDLQKTICEIKEVKNENNSLRNVINFIPDSVDYELITARLGFEMENFYSAKSSINAGKLVGLNSGDAVVYNNTLVGVISKLGQRYSTINLITDHKIKISAISETSKTRVIITGLNNGKCKVLYKESAKKIEQGEIFVTSGGTKNYPYGIKIGIVESISTDGTEIIIDPFFKHLKFDFINIIKSKNH